MSIAQRRSNEDATALRARLAEAEPSVLLMALVQLSGDLTLLDRFGPHLGKPGEFSHSIAPAMMEELLDRMAAQLTSGSGQARLTDPSALTRMMSVLAREPISDRYQPMLLDDLGFSRPAPPFAGADAATLARRDAFKVLIIGAGASGICAGIMLKQAGIPFEIVERNDDVGGVWHENTYPGCGVDSANHLYCYSFELNHHWSRYYVKQPELRDYLRDCARRHGLIQHIRFGQEVTALRWDAGRNLWRGEIRTSAGTRQIAANAVVSAVGQLNQPAIPRIEGLERFAGVQMHTARWNHDVSFAGRNVAMVGTGASGMQAGPAVAGEVNRLTIFQRSAPWVLPRHNYHNLVSDGVKWVMANVPHYAQWYRLMLFWAYGDAIHPALIIDPDWTKPGSISARNEEVRKLWTKYVDAEVGDLPELHAKALPDYPPLGKRSLRDNGWYRTLRRDNVELVTTPIAEVVPDGIVDRDGRHHPAEIIVFATGFHASRMIYPMEVEGVGGATFRALWGDDDPRAYLGICVPGFPNFFMCYGPNTNLAHGGSIIFQSECQAGYIVRSLEMLLRSGGDALDNRQAAHDAYNEKLDAACARMVWSDRGTTNWYKNASGRITTNSPWTLVDYWHMTRAPDPAAFDFLSTRGKHRGAPA